MTDQAGEYVQSFKEERQNTRHMDFSGRALPAAMLSLICNSLYALYNGILGICHSSLWLFSMSAFYSILAVMRFIIILYGQFTWPKTLIRESWILRTVGALLILLGTVLAYVNAISLSQQIATSYDTIPMITIAAYTFYKVIAVIIKALRQRSKNAMMVLALRNISCAEAAASVLTLQRSMLASFGTMEKNKICLMNGLTGAGIFLLILALGVFMIVRSGRRDH